ncbi:MAG: hypothetical protein Q6352_015865 [Candidatus Freyrarchaeum guaymaensis]
MFYIGRYEYIIWIILGIIGLLALLASIFIMAGAMVTLQGVLTIIYGLGVILFTFFAWCHWYAAAGIIIVIGGIIALVGR